MSLQQTMLSIARAAIQANLPDEAVRRAMSELQSHPCAGQIILVSVGKAGWEMARAASNALDGKFDAGFLITKYGHSRGPLPGFSIFEAGHPVLDQNAIDATRQVEQAVMGLCPDDRVVLLLSGGGSALLEDPLVPLSELSALTCDLLACGADIIEINTIRKRLSAVKGGRFGALCAPAQVWSVILSDVVGDRPDMIASGPAFPDASTADDALAIAQKYSLKLSPQIRHLLSAEPVKALPNIHTLVTGGVVQLCAAAKAACEQAGYPAEILTTSMTCEAREAGNLLGSIASYQASQGVRRALIAGGETVVHLSGTGLGGRNQELALAAAGSMRGVSGVALLSIGSDGTDGPTDAAGGFVDGETLCRLQAAGINYDAILENHDSYHALQACGGLIKTGATGTNVNDLVIILTEG